ncbi:MAG: DUF2752 domain-containing protein [Planctomycetota bacterium]
MDRTRSSIRVVESSRRLPIPAWAAGVVLGWLALVGIYETIKHPSAPGLCILRETTGVPCPACGSTRAVLAASDGRLLDAFLFNPLLAVSAVGGAAWLVLRWGFGRTVKLDPSIRARRALWCGAAAVLVLHWGYVIAREWTDPPGAPIAVADAPLTAALDAPQPPG